MGRGAGRAAWVCVVLAAAVACFAGVLRAEGEAGSGEQWYVLMIDGQRAGWMHERGRETSRGNLLSETEMSIRLERLGTAVEMTLRMGFLETPGGEAVEIRQVQNMGVMGSVKSSYRFEEEGVVAVVEQMGRSSEKVLPLPEGAWLTPLQVRDFEAAKIAAGEESFSYSTVDATMGLRVVEISCRVLGRENVEVMGKVVPAVRIESRSSVMPGMVTTEWVDARGGMVKSTVDLGGITMDVLASEKELALSDFEAPELMAQTLVRPEGRIDSPRSARRATYVLRVDEGEMPELVTGGAQRVEVLDERRVRVVVDVDSPLEATPEEREDARYAEASTAADSADPAIVALVERATRGLEGASAMERARAMEAFVAGYISNKSLGVGFATASEVCQTREGDCSEHSLLLATMLRADGIPSRGVSGLVYVDQFVGERKVFGYHMWAQGLIEVDGAARWIDLDAAVRPMDATHIALTTSSLADGDVINSMVGVARAMSTLAIEVESVE